jgi:hypothetical protein
MFVEVCASSSKFCCMVMSLCLMLLQARLKETTFLQSSPGYTPSSASRTSSLFALSSHNCNLGKVGSILHLVPPIDNQPSFGKRLVHPYPKSSKSITPNIQCQGKAIWNGRRVARMDLESSNLYRMSPSLGPLDMVCLLVCWCLP